MNHWKESAEIFARLAALAAEGTRAALATVVDVNGSAYRRPGAKLLVADSGATVGGVSGGCMEADVREIAKNVMETRVPSLRHYDAGEDDPIMGLALGCNGVVDIFVQSATSHGLGGLARTVRTLLDGDAPVALATVISGGPEVGAMMAIAFGEGGVSSSVTHGTLGHAQLDAEVVHRVAAHYPSAKGRCSMELVAGHQVFIELLVPPPHLLVCGAGPDAMPLVAYAADAGFRVTLLDHREALLEPASYPQATSRILTRPEDPEVTLPPPSRCLAVVKTHSLAHDRDWVRVMLRAGVPYIGVLGPRDRTETILRELCEQGGTPVPTNRVFGPVGLDLGADGPEQVAISIVAELLAFVAKREPLSLRQRQQPIHSD